MYIVMVNGCNDNLSQVWWDYSKSCVVHTSKEKAFAHKRKMQKAHPGRVYKVFKLMEVAVSEKHKAPSRDSHSIPK